MLNFKIVVPAYNAEAWIESCIKSLAFQAYRNFECVIVNDASTDNTGKVLDAIPYIKDDSRFTVIHNEENKKALYNIVKGFQTLKTAEDPESVLMVVDGDDHLFSPASLAIVNSAYSHYPTCLITYGNHVHYPTGGQSNCEPFPKEVIQQAAYRKYKFVSSHLRTFKSKLWNSIKDEHLKDEDGTYYGVGWDVAFMMPMLEMAHERVLFIPNVLYVYNRANPISDDVIRQDDQHRVEMRIRSLPKYERYQE